jgi:hypothetical protein
VADILNPEWVNNMKRLGIPIYSHCMLFYRDPEFNTHWAHIDIDGKDKVTPASVGFNIIIDGEDSDMVWYNTPPKPWALQYTMANTAYVGWPMKSLIEVDRARIVSNLAVVRVDVPHGIIMRSKPRWCISLRLIGKNCVWNPYSWDSAVNYLRAINVLIER